MQAITSYRRYPEIVKEEVARSGNVYLFPDLKIPRTTAQYWVKKKRRCVNFLRRSERYFLMTLELSNSETKFHELKLSQPFENVSNITSFRIAWTPSGSLRAATSVGFLRPPLAEIPLVFVNDENLSSSRVMSLQRWRNSSLQKSMPISPLLPYIF